MVFGQSRQVCLCTCVALCYTLKTLGLKFFLKLPSQYSSILHNPPFTQH
uniref:Uncharacterized protein n=1 Tax=Anguilla anguilla TaxID=7936 RepID=A0A0E9VKK6_ANGAN